MNRKIIFSTIITVGLPCAMYLLMLIVTIINGIDYYGGLAMWRTVFTNLGLSFVMGAALAMQMRHGRFDFSGGANMILAGILGCYYAQKLGGNPYLMLLLCILISMLISLITAVIYIWTKLPIIICSIMMALIYEALTLVMAGGNGVNIISNQAMNMWGKVPATIYILIFTFVLYQFVLSKTPFGKKAKLLKFGQQVSVNIGIDEKKNVIYSYLLSGFLFGIAAAVYVSQTKVVPQTNLSSTGTLFSNVASVYIGMFLGRLSCEAIGILVGAITIAFMNYGLQMLGLGAGGWNNVAFGVFIMAFWIITAKANQIGNFFRRHILHEQDLGDRESEDLKIG